MTPYRTVDIEARRQAAIREAKRVRDALDGSERFHCIARHPWTRQFQIGSSQEIIDAIDACLRELEATT